MNIFVKIISHNPHTSAFFVNVNHIVAFYPGVNPDEGEETARLVLSNGSEYIVSPSCLDSLFHSGTLAFGS